MRFHFTVLTITFLLCATASHQAQTAPTKALEISEENAQLLDKLGDYPNLEVLKISCVEGLRSLPDSIGNLTKLKELVIDNGNGCSMNPLLPESIGNLSSLEKLVLFGAQDPRASGGEHQPRERHKFPLSMSKLKNLVYLDLGRNGLAEIPAFVKDLPKLRELGFAWNMYLRVIPPWLMNLRELKTLRLESDGLTDLPDFLKRMPKLTRITLGNNCKITQNQPKKRDLRRRFPRITFDFADEYDCADTTAQ